MSIQVTCKQCGVTLKTADSSAGKEAKCPKCQATLVIPMPAAEPEPVVDAIQSSDDDLWGDFDQAAELTENSSAGSGENRIPCPTCGEMIMADAAKCRYCDEFFVADLAKVQKNKKGSYSDTEASLSSGEWVVAILCSGIGCIAGLVWMAQGKPKGKKMLTVSLCVQGFWFVVRVLIEIANQQR